jgi:hypothetical protein
MSVLTRIVDRLVNPSRLLRTRKRPVPEPPCSPKPPRDPEPVRPPDPGCSTGPDPGILRELRHKKG